MTTSGIRTEYAGSNFRSRLEARWANFFDMIAWRWEYEPFDADGYIPDFVILGNSPLLVEVKPVTTYHELMDSTNRILKAIKNVWKHDVLFLGISPFFLPVGDVWGKYNPRIGFLAEYEPEGDDFWLSDGIVSSCIDCKRISVVHDVGCYICRPCGHYPGGHINELEIPQDVLQILWNKAGSRTQWLPK